VPRILLTFALRQEGVSFERMLTRRNLKSGVVLGFLGSRSVAVSWLGTGVRDEARFENMLSDLGIELVINSGFAGAVRTLLEPGDFVLAENFSSTELVKRLEKHRGFEASGRFVTVDMVADSVAKMRINCEGNVVALDMESAKVAAICRKLFVPLISARMISDRSDERIPEVFLGKGIRQMKDISEAFGFASRMIALRRRLAHRLVELIHALSPIEEGKKPQITQI
jgi:nucleoside phosphorylase